MMWPFGRKIDLFSGDIEAADSVVERRLSDMKNAFVDPPTGDTVVYRVYNVDAPATGDDIRSCTTVLSPGKSGNEYYMTKGHFHEVRSRAEIYLGLSGEGLLVMANEQGDYAVEPMGPGIANYVPGGWAHRSVNTGPDPLVFFAAYIGDAGHDYGTIETKGFPVIVVEGSTGPEVVANPRYANA